MAPRLTSEFWVQAYLRRLNLGNIPAYVMSKGDPTAGAVLIKVNTLDGAATAHQRSYNLDGNRIWVVLIEGSDADVETALQKQRSFDPDIWIIEVESRDGHHMLDAPGLSG